MSLLEELDEAFADAGYDVAETSRNRDRIRIAIRDDRAEADDLRSVVSSVLDGDDVLGLDVTTESSDAESEVSTVVSFQYRG